MRPGIMTETVNFYEAKTSLSVQTLGVGEK